MPQNLLPSETTGYFPVRVYDNGVIVFGIGRVTTAGVIELLAGPDGSSFTAAGTKGIGGCSFTYNLDVS